jgi:hypothetical protein
MVIRVMQECENILGLLVEDIRKTVEEVTNSYYNVVLDSKVNVRSE